MAVMHTDVSEEAKSKKKVEESLTARNYLLRRLVRNRIFYGEAHLRWLIINSYLTGLQSSKKAVLVYLK